MVYFRQNEIDLPKAYSEIMDRLSRDHFKRKAVYEVLQEQGYKVLSSVDDACTEPGIDHRLKETAKRLGVTSRRHVGTIDYDLEKMLIGFQAGEIARSEVESFAQLHKGEFSDAQLELLSFFKFVN